MAKYTTSVLENLIDAETGEKAVKDLVVPAFKDNKIASLHVLGRPASGKTTIIGQFIEIADTIAGKTSIHLKITTTFFDKVQAKSEKSIKLENAAKTDSKSWNTRDWQSFEKLLIDAITDPAVRKLAGKTKTFLTVETPYILYWERRNNGRKIIKNLSKKTPKTLYLYVVGDRETVRKTVEMRVAIIGDEWQEPLSAKGLVKTLERDYNTIIVGFKNSEKSGREIRRIVKRMAPREAVLRIQNKTKEIANNWAKNNSMYRKYLNKITLPKVYNELPKETRSLYKKEAAYMLYVFREELKLPPQRSKVVFNPNMPGKKIYMYLKLLTN